MDEREHPLPPEIINEILVHAARSDQTIALKLCLVCRAARTWLIPILYDTVALRCSGDIILFYNALEASVDESEIIGTPSLTSYVHHIWMGPTSGGHLTSDSKSNGEDNNLIFDRNAYPLTIVNRILWMCATSLRTLAICHLSQNKWRFLESVIPPTLESLLLGPIHGPLILSNLVRGPRLKTITSVDSWMRDEEVRAILSSPHCRHLRHVFSCVPPLTYFLELYDRIDDAEKARKTSIEVFGEPSEIQSVPKNFRELIQASPIAFISHELGPTQGMWSILYSEWKEQAC